MKKTIYVVLLTTIMSLLFCSCANINDKEISTEKNITIETTNETEEEYDYYQSTTDYTTTTYQTTKYFTNKYGDPFTYCAHSGCTNYIASSGDTNCCSVHSKRCLECGKYIDEDASYCLDCLTDALYAIN